MYRKKVLIIDDDERNIFALKAVLTSKGYACLEATNGSNALNLLRTDKSIRVALVDMMMPGLDGYGLLNLARADEEIDGIYFIAVTAQAMIGDREKCLAAGANAYIPKPVDVDLLKTYLDEFMPE